MESEFKRCSDCREIKLRVEYYKNCRQSDGLETRCKGCNVLRKKAKIAYFKSLVVEHLLKNPCIDCGERDIVVLDFDHVTGEKDMSISDMIKSVRSVERFKNEILKCAVRCANCHRKKTARDFGSYRLNIKL